MYKFKILVSEYLKYSYSSLYALFIIVTLVFATSAEFHTFAVKLMIPRPNHRMRYPESILFHISTECCWIKRN